MIEFVWIDGMAVRVTNFVRRRVELEGDGERWEVEMVVIVRGGERAHREMRELVAPRRVRLEIPGEDGAERFDAEVVRADFVVVGQGEATAYRHEVTLRDWVANSEAEEISVEVRLAALIEALEEAGMVTRGSVDEIARRMMAKRPRL